ncbi:hypothetical protein DWU98_08735 [Dyella monticola]|uniref:Chitin-binding type-3 domain-containing protein n=2 Tax=Dyella monticola TaxID=1927958 RepID=A0A370X1N8_9GAMM|nr:hypothetical protein DWU98_08735 [Dyella monticola]
MQTLPQYWDPDKTYEPGDQVVYNGNIYEAPNQGGSHHGVKPGGDDSKWLYHGTFQNYYKHILSRDAAHNIGDKLRSGMLVSSLCS